MYLDTCIIHVSRTKAELDGLYPGAWCVVGQRADQRVPTHGGRERPRRDDDEAQPHDVCDPAGNLASWLCPDDRLFHTPGRRPALRTPLAGAADSHARVGLPRDRALGVVRLCGGPTRM